MAGSERRDGRRTPNAGSPPLGETVRVWDATAAERIERPVQGWMDFAPLCEACVLPKIGGGPGHHWLRAAVERHSIPRDGRWLSVGCGTGGTEIAAARWGLFGSLQGLDASPESIEIARRAAAIRE